MSSNKTVNHLSLRSKRSKSLHVIGYGQVELPQNSVVCQFVVKCLMKEISCGHLPTWLLGFNLDHPSGLCSFPLPSCFVETRSSIQLVLCQSGKGLLIIVTQMKEITSTGVTPKNQRCSGSVPENLAFSNNDGVVGSHVDRCRFHAASLG